MELIVELLNVILVLSVISVVGVILCMAHQFILHRRIDEVDDTLTEHYEAFARNQEFQKDSLDLRQKDAKSNLALHEAAGKRMDALSALVKSIRKEVDDAKP